MGIKETFIMDQISDSHLIIAVSGSILVGLGLGMVFRNGGTTGGMDIIQSILHNLQLIFYFTDGFVILLSLHPI